MVRAAQWSVNGSLSTDTCQRSTGILITRRHTVYIGTHVSVVLTLLEARFCLSRMEVTMDVEELLSVRLKYWRGGKYIYSTIPVVTSTDDPDKLISLSSVRSTFNLDGRHGMAITGSDLNYQVLDWSHDESYFVVIPGDTYEVYGVEYAVDLTTPTQSFMNSSKTVASNSYEESISLVSSEDTPPTMRMGGTPNSGNDDEDGEDGEEYITGLCSQEVNTPSAGRQGMFPPYTLMVSKIPDDIDGNVMYGHRTDLPVATTVGKTPWFFSKRPWGHADLTTWSEAHNILKDQCSRITIRRQKCSSDGVCVNKECPHLLTFDTPHVQPTKGKRKVSDADDAQGPRCSKCGHDTKLGECNATLKSVIAEVLPEHGGGNVLICSHSGVHQCHITRDKGKREYTHMTEQLLAEALPHHYTEGVAKFR